MLKDAAPGLHPARRRAARRDQDGADPQCTAEGGAVAERETRPKITALTPRQQPARRLLLLVSRESAANYCSDRGLRVL